jgi:outer membrane protein TolC
MHFVPRNGARALCLTSSLLLLTGAAPPSAPVPRTPEALAQWARTRSPRARAAALESTAVERAAEGAGEWFDPMLAVRAAPLSTPGLLPVDPRDAMPFGAELMLSQRLPLSGRLSQEQQRARALGERAQHLKDAVLLDLEREAALLSCAAWEAESLQRVRLRHIDVLRAMAANARGEIESGRATVGDAQRVDAEVVRLENDVVEIEAEKRAIDAETNALLGRAPDAPLGPPPDAAPLLAPPPLTVDIEARDEVRASTALVTAAEADRVRAADAWIPDLTATVSWSSMWPLTHQLMLGVAVDLPVFNRGRDAEQASAGLMREGASALVEQEKLRAQAALSAAHVRDSATDQVRARLADKLVPLAAARAETARASLSGGASLNAALDATHEEREAEVELVRATAAHCKTRAELWRAAGTSFVTQASVVQP